MFIYLIMLCGMISAFLDESCQGDVTMQIACWSQSQQWRKRWSLIALSFSACPHALPCMVLWPSSSASSSSTQRPFVSFCGRSQNELHKKFLHLKRLQLRHSPYIVFIFYIKCMVNSLCCDGIWLQHCIFPCPSAGTSYFGNRRWGANK